MAFAAVSCLIETLEALLRLTLLAVKIKSFKIEIEGKQPAVSFIRDSVQNSARFLIGGRYLFPPVACPQEEGSPHYDDSNYTSRQNRYFLNARTTEMRELLRVLCCFLIFLKDFGSICHDREKMQYLERRLTDLANSIEDTIEETVFDRSIISKAFNFINDVLNEDPMSVMGEVSFMIETLDLFDEKCRIHLHLQKAWREIDLIKGEVKMINYDEPIANVDLQLGQSSGIADSLQHMPTKKSEVFDMDDGFLSVLDRVIRVPSGLQMVAIVGMGGIGKTTLAQRIYDYPLTCHHFSMRAWVVVYQVYRVKDMLVGLTVH